MTTYLQSKLLQKELREWVGHIGADYFVTLTFNSNINMYGARKALAKWHARVDRKLLGKYWCSEALDKRLFFIAFAEKISSNIHWHVAVKLADTSRAKIFEAKAEDCWLATKSSGTFDNQKIETFEDATRIKNYVCKEQWQDTNFNAFIISEEFVINDAA